jgi:hypothetical protein
MPDLMRIPLASADYKACFERPAIGFIGSDRPRAAEAIIDALLPFGFRLANSEVVTTGPLSDHKLIFKFPDRGLTLQFGAETYQFTKDGSNWATAPDDVKILIAAKTALLDGTSIKIGSCLVTVAMHAQLLTRPREEVLFPFIPAPFHKDGWAKAISYGNHLRWPDGDLLIDFSAVYANGIFMKFSSRFEGHPPIEQILEAVRASKNSVFELLGIQEQGGE